MPGEGEFEVVSTGNHERTGLEGATENGSGCPVREPCVRWVRFPSSGFESSVDERSEWCTIIDMIDTERRLCRPEGSDSPRSRQPLELVKDCRRPGGGRRRAGPQGDRSRDRVGIFDASTWEHSLRLRGDTRVAFISEWDPLIRALAAERHR